MIFDYDSFFQSELQQLKDRGNYRSFANIERVTETYPHAAFHHTEATQQATIWCSNDYMAMSRHPAVIDALTETAAKHGAGSGGTRNISGTSVFHTDLERAVAHWHGKQRALVFSSAYTANLTALSVMGRKIKDMVFLSDSCNHASMIEGMRSTPCEKIIFKHNSVDDLYRHLKTLDKKRPKMVVFESVYSMSGTMAPLEKFCDLADEFNALTYLDEVHAVGLYGPTGAGIAEEVGLADRLTFINGTFSKAIGVIGGYIAGEATAIDFIRSFGPGFIFTTSLPPAICAAIKASIETLQKETHKRVEYFARVRRLKNKLKAAGVTYGESPSHIVPIPIGDPVKCKRVADDLLRKYAVYVQPINYPTVPWGEECLRVTLSPLHTDMDMDHLVDALRDVLQVVSPVIAEAA
jgi:5-aminolevulinate synthase